MANLFEDIAKALFKIDSEERKKKALDSVTPESLRERISAIEKANYDGDKSKISTDEAVSFLKPLLNLKGLDERDPRTGKTLKEHMISDCRLAGTDSENGQYLRSIMDAGAAIHTPKLDFPIMVAKALSSSDGKDHERLDTTIANYANYLAANSVDKSNSGTNQELVKMEEESTRDTVLALGMKVKQIIKDNKDIRDSLNNMPNITELGNLNAEHFCRATTGNGIGVSKS